MLPGGFAVHSQEVGKKEAQVNVTNTSLYIEDNGGCYSDIDRVFSICPQLIVGRTVCSGHFPTIEVPDQINAMIEG